MSNRDAKADELRAAIAGLEAKRALVGDAVIEPAIAALRRQLKDLDAAAEERKIVTILFVDVSGFTALSEKLDPEEVRSVINACFDQLVPVVQKYGGTIDKFIGDEIMALFGAPLSHDNDPERALRSALEMMTEMTLFNEEHETALRLHIGVNTGPVVTGTIGSRDRKDYSVMGDAVNLAARLEDASPDGEIYVGPITYRLTSAIFDFEALPQLILKGKDEPLSAYRLIGLRSVPKPSRGIEGLHSKLIGRSRELEAIGDGVRNLRAGTGGIFSVVGEAGLGKSRLITEAIADFAGDLFRAEGRALSHTTGMSYWMARDVLRALLASPEGAPPDQLEVTLHRSLQDLESDTLETYPYLATILQLPLKDEMLDRVRFLSSEALQGRIRRAFEHYVAARARRERLIIFWEDLHWCDPSSLVILETLLPLAASVPLMLILAYRPEDATTEALQTKAQTLGGAAFHLIALSPLNREQSGSLVEGLLQIEGLPAEVQKLILDRADGNPFFIEELLRSLLDCGAVVKRDGRVFATAGIRQAPIPETVQGVLTARMDRLTADQKNALQSAAVIGRSFQRKVLLHITPMENGGTLDACLSELRQRDFIRVANDHAGSNGDYIFKHAITQDVAYNALLKTRRKQIHQKVGEAFESLFADRLSDLSATLGYHFERAEAQEKAFKYLRQAGEHAQATFANAEAAAFYRSAIAQAEALLKRTPDHEAATACTQVQESLGDVLQLAGNNEEARTSYRAAFDRVRDQCIPRSRLHRKIGQSYTLGRKYSEMAEAYDLAASELGEKAVEPLDQWWDEKMQILLARMHLLYWQGMADKMMELAEKHRVEIEQNGTPIQRGKFYHMLGLLHLTRSRYAGSDEAVRLTELAVAVTEGSSELSEVVPLRFVAGLTNLFNGNLRGAIEHLQDALAVAERVGDLIVQARCLAYLTVAYRRSGNQSQTGSFAKRTTAIATQLDMVEYIAMAKANLAWLAWREGRDADAESLGREALNLWHGMDDPYGVDWQALLPLIAVAVAADRLGEAIEFTRGLFGENQHPPPPALAAAAKEVINISAQTAPEVIKPKLERLIAVSKEIGYL